MDVGFENKRNGTTRKSTRTKEERAIRKEELEDKQREDMAAITGSLANVLKLGERFMELGLRQVEIDLAKNEAELSSVVRCEDLRKELMFEAANAANPERLADIEKRTVMMLKIARA